MYVVRVLPLYLIEVLKLVFKVVHRATSGYFDMEIRHILSKIKYIVIKEHHCQT